MNARAPSPSWRIRALWVGPRMTELEWASLASFVHHGAEVELFSDRPRSVPRGVIVSDASTLLRKVIRYGPRSGRHAGSLAISADLARVTALKRYGGWWTDTDVICLKPFAPIDSGFRVGWETDTNTEPHRARAAVGVIRADRGDPIVNRLYERGHYPLFGSPWEHPLRRLWNVWAYRDTWWSPGNVPWGHTAGPRALTNALRHYGRLAEVLPREAFYPVRWEDWASIPKMSTEALHALASTSYAVHLWADAYAAASVDRGRAIAEAAWSAPYLEGFRSS